MANSRHMSVHKKGTLRQTYMLQRTKHYDILRTNHQQPFAETESVSDDPFSSASKDWLAFQQQYSDAWRALGDQVRETTSTAETPTNPWAEALDSWWKAVSAGATPEVNDFYARLSQQAKAFFRLSEGFGQMTQTATASGDAVAQWQDQMQQALAGLKKNFSEPNPNTHEFMRQVMAFWELPLDTWQRTASSMSVLPNDFLQNLKAGKLEHMQDITGRMNEFLSAPGVGYTRERQEQLQTQAKLLLDYQNAYQDYAAGYAKIGLQSVERLEAVLKAQSKDNKSVTGMRELYDLWVDCCEDAYGEHVSTDEYAELHGRLVNRLMALKQHSREMIDQLLDAIGIPTRRETNTLHRRLQEVRREGKAMRAELEALKAQTAMTERRMSSTAPPQNVATKTKIKKVRRTSPVKKTKPTRGRATGRNAIKEN
jgi:class III poly(R)-hydroxyalkanoic acid synthase PhaE subunit